MNLFDDRTPGEPFTVSATLYTTYLECPQRALGRLRGQYGAPSAAAVKGGLAHRVFAAHLEDGAMSGDEVDQVCRQAVGQNWSLQSHMSDLGMGIAEFRSIVAEVSALYDRFRTLEHDGFVEAEKSFDFDAGGGITIKGSMDAVFESDGETRIVDWKTGTYVSDNEPQLDFYSFVWNVLYDDIPAAAEAMSVATGENLHLEPTKSSIDTTADHVGEMIDVLRGAMADGSDLDRNAGPYCQWCPLLDTCQEGMSAMEIL